MPTGLPTAPWAPPGWSPGLPSGGLGSTQPVPVVGGDTGSSIPADGGSGGGVDWGGLLSGVVSAGGDVAGFLKDHAGDIATWVKNNSGGLLQAAGIADAAYREKQANDYAQSALKTSTDAYTAKAPLRALGIAGLTNAGQGNPFATRSGGAMPVAPVPPALQNGAIGAFGGLNGQPPQQPPQPPRTLPVAAPTTGPNLNPSAPMRIAGY